MTMIEATLADWLERYSGEGVHLGRLLCDVHAQDAVAIVYDGADGTERVSYGELRERSRRLAGALGEVGVGEGDRVAVILPKSVELVVTLLAILRVGAVHVPLFTAFGPDAVSYRVAHSGARLLVSDTVNRRKVDAVEIPVMCVRKSADVRTGDYDFTEAVARGPLVAGVARGADDLMFLLYTSGTTGQPKGVEVPVRALASIHSYMHYGLDVRPDDVFWNVADPGWAYGLWYGITGSLLLGHPMLLRGRSFDAEDVFEAILEHSVTNLAGAPTVFRALRTAGVPDGFRERCRLRAVSSAGEPLDAELLEWSARHLGVQIHDHYGQSETGMVAGFPQSSELHRNPVPGSMGFALPGFRTVIMGGDGREAAGGVEGELAIDTEASPLYWFRGYYGDPVRTADRFRLGRGYYLTADTVRREEDGRLHFGSRADDVITSSGYRIGPFEVESALVAHAAVTEAAVIGTPDELRGEAVTAFVVTTPGVEGTPELATELQLFVKSRLAKHLCPRRLRFLEALPRTPSGKVRRTILRDRWIEEEASA